MIPTVIFAVYVAGLVGALLTVGSLSDHLGRRPVLVASSRTSRWWDRLRVTPFDCNNIRECITASRWRVRSKIADCAIVTTTVIGLTAVSLVLAAPASAT
jgi:MFS family permease